MAKIRGLSRGWAANRRWLALDAGNLGEAPYSATGQPPVRSQQQRLVAFAASALRPDKGRAADDHPACRQPQRWRVLRQLAGRDGVALPARPTCTALDAFADPDKTTSLEVLFVAPSSTRAAASFGHLVLRLVRGDPDAVDAAERDPAFEITALTGFHHSSLSYLAQGMSGGFPLVFEQSRLRTVLADNLHGQQRSIRRLRLNLTRAQRRAVLELLWQVERELALPYRFLNRNCGTYLVWLLATALDGKPHIDPKVFLYASPAAMVDRLARVTMRHDGRPLLAPQPGTFETSEQRKDRAKLTMYAARNELSRLNGGLGNRWRYVDLGSLKRVRQLTTETLKTAPKMAPVIHRLLLASVWVTRADVDVTKARADKIERERVQAIPGRPFPGIREVMGWRRTFFQHEDPKWRRQRRIERVLWVQDYMKKAPRRPATSSEKASLAQAEAAHARFVQVTDVYAEVAGLLSITDPAALERRWLADLTKREQQAWGQRVVRGPADFVGLGVEQGRDAGWALVLGTAFWREELGQWRPHGLGPLSTFVLADIDTRFEIRNRRARWLSNRARLFEFAKMTKRPVEGVWSWLERLGWGMGIHGEVTRERVDLSVRLDGYALLLDGVGSPWLAGLRAGAMPTLRRTDDATMDIQGVLEPFVQRRIGSTGRLALGGQYWRSWRTQRMAAELVLDVPWGQAELFRTVTRLRQRCDARWRCDWTWYAGLSW
ncbi:MAG: DUF4105 domain-containing protein [Myxococcales bacterium]|nr:DUF4105 domain-containing protein [Myxococcales bacterium]